MKTRKKTRAEKIIILIAATGFLVGILLLNISTYQGYKEDGIRRYLAEHGVTTTGIVLESKTHRVRRSPGRRVRVAGEYSINQTTYPFIQGLRWYRERKDALISIDTNGTCGNLFDELSALRSGESVDIIYDPSNPKIARPYTTSFPKADNCEGKHLGLTIVYTLLSVFVIYGLFFGRVIAEGEHVPTFKEAMQIARKSKKK